MIKVKKSEFQKLYDLACESWKNKFNVKFQGKIFDNELEFEPSFLEEMKKACTEPQLKIFNKIFNGWTKEEDLSSIKTYSQVCKKLEIKELKEKDFKQFGNQAKKMLNFHKIKNLETLFNGNWKADWNDISQYKYYPYFYKNSVGGWVHGVGFGHGGVGCGDSVGYYKDRETALHVGEKFKDIYMALLL